MVDKQQGSQPGILQLEYHSSLTGEARQLYDHSEIQYRGILQTSTRPDPVPCYQLLWHSLADEGAAG